MNILFVIPNLAIGGAQSFLLRLASEMARNTNDTIVLFDVHPKSENKKFYEALLSSQVIHIKSKSESVEKNIEEYTPSFLADILKKTYYKFNRKSDVNGKHLAKIIKRYKIDVINSHMYLADLYIKSLKPFVPNHVKWILSFHGCYNLLLEKTNSNLTEQLKDIITKSDGVIILCEKHNTVFSKLGISECRTEKIYHGFIPHLYEKINFRKNYNIEESALVFGMVARGDISKGWDVAIQAFNLIKDEKNAYLVLTGDGEYLVSLQERFKDNSRIIFTGPTDKPLQIIEHFDIGLLPTTYAAESLPNTVIEYLFANKPVIASDWAEIPKMIESPSGLAGIIVPVNDNQVDIKLLSEAFERYLDSPELLKKHSAFADEAFRKFEMQKCITNYMNFFNEEIK